MIRLRFVTSDRSAISVGIQFAQYGFWSSHVEALMPEGTLLGAHASGGVMNRPPDYDAATWTREEWVDIPASPAETDLFYSFIRKEIGKPYDLTAIAAFVARRDWREDDSWFCSELVMEMLLRAGIIRKLATEVNHLTPRDCRIIVSAIGGVSTGINSRANPGGSQ